MNGVTVANLGSSANKVTSRQSITYGIEGLKNKIISGEKDTYDGRPPQYVLDAIEQRFKQLLVSVGNINSCKSSEIQAILTRALRAEDLTSAYLAMGELDKSISTFSETV